MLINVEHGTPQGDPRTFRKALGQFGTGVVIVTTIDGGSPVGVTVNSFTSVSLDPPFILWSIDRSSRSFDAFTERGRGEAFVVNVLGESQVRLSQVFASKVNDKFDGVGWQPGGDGAPLLDGAIAHFECRREAAHDGGDHVILIGRVLRYARFEGSGLMFMQGRYAVAQDHPESLEKMQPLDNRIETPHDELPLLSLVAKVHYLEDRGLDSYRQAQQLSLINSKVLAGLYGTAGLTVVELATVMLLDERAVEDAAADLAAQGLVARDMQGRLLLTPDGIYKRQRIIEGVIKYQKERLKAIPREEIEAGRRLLLRILATE